MNCYYKKEVNCILGLLKEKLPSCDIFSLWNQCEQEYLESRGIQVEVEQSNEKVVQKCEWPDCIKNVCKPIAVDNKVFCYTHRTKYIKQSKQEAPTCLHVFSANSKLSGQRCSSKTIDSNGYCVRHQKKKGKVDIPALCEKLKQCNLPLASI